MPFTAKLRSNVHVTSVAVSSLPAWLGQPRRSENVYVRPQSRLGGVLAAATTSWLRAAASPHPLSHDAANGACPSAAADPTNDRRVSSIESAN